MPTPLSTRPAGRPLTASGLGRTVDAASFQDVPAVAAAVRSAALGSGLALVRDLRLTEQDFRTLVHHLGHTVDNHYRSGGSDLLRLQGRTDPGAVINGRGALPLHTDGLLLGQQVDLIVLYAADVQGPDAADGTVVCDQLSAWRDLPEDLRTILESREFQYRGRDSSHFPDDVQDGWVTVPVHRDYGRVRSLNITLPFADDAEAGWEVRVNGLDEPTTEAFFADLGRWLHAPEYCYTHHWRTGDLLVIDNQQTLHGRTALADARTRVLFRGQAVLEPS
ncbi:TauD/TfdA family dioxygenase [Streptomyces sp. NPDC058718]|uniref:TauD/TfdA family dioxygenase n=1 Tax=Streptomyces sp. NPDC058718 TaxID=3346610 RepID=UPI003684BC27